MRDLVIISLEAWDEVWRRNQHLLARLLRDDPLLRVLWIEPSVDPLHNVLSRNRPRLARGLREGPKLMGVSAGRLRLHEAIKVFPRRLDRGQDDRWAGSVIRQAAKLNMRQPVLWVNAPIGARVLEQSGWPSIYDITDDWLLADRPAAEQERLRHDEAVLLDRAAEVVVCSPQLQRTKGGLGQTTLIPNGVDVDHYRRAAARPTDLPTGGTAVYVGTLHRDRFDVALAEQTARALGDRATLVLVGPELLPPADHDRLIRAGVAILGSRPSSAVPGYLQHADVLVVPHVVNSFTDSLDPIKVYEYLAVGRPVVSTPVAGFRDCASDSFQIAAGTDFAGAVVSGIPAAWNFPSHSDLPVPSWDSRAQAMREVLQRVGRWS